MSTKKEAFALLVLGAKTKSHCYLLCLRLFSYLLGYFLLNTMLCDITIAHLVTDILFSFTVFSFHFKYNVDDIKLLGSNALLVRYLDSITFFLLSLQCLPLCILL